MGSGTNKQECRYPVAKRRRYQFVGTEVPFRAIRHPTDAIQGLKTLRLFTEQLVATVSAEDPRAQHSTVSLAELSAGPIAVCATAPTATGHLWENQSTTPHSITVANTDEWLTRNAVGDAIGVTAEATTHNHHEPEVAYLRIKDAHPVAVDLIWPAENFHPQAPIFAAFANDYFTELVDNYKPPLLLSDETSPMP